MRKMLVILIILSLVMVSGCATIKDKFCDNRVKIESAITQANNLINSITAVFGSVIPPEYLLVIAAAQNVVTTGEAMLAANWCPTDADVATITEKSETMTVKLKTATLKKK